MEKMAAIFKIVQDSMTKEEFVAAFEVLRKKVVAMQSSNEADFKLMQGALDALSAKLKADNSDDSQAIQKACDEMMKKCEMQMEQMMALVRNLEDGEDGEDGADADPAAVVPLVLAALPPDIEETGDQIIEKINGASELIAKSAVEGMEELEKAVAEKTGNTTRIGWGAHPITVQGLGITIDKNTRIINFKGTAVSSVVRRPDGVIDVTLTQGGGSSGTLVQEEIPTDSGNHINFTLAHTPLTGTFYLWRGGARQQSIGTSPDFMQTGTALTLTNALNVAEGETLLVSYQY